MNLAAVVVLVVATSCAVAAVASPFVGLLTYLWFDFMRPHDWWVELRAYRPMLLLSLVTVGAALWQQRRHLLDRWAGSLPLLALATVVTLSTLHSSDPATSVGTLVQVLKMVALVWLLSVLVTTDARFDATLWVIALSLLVLAIAAVLQGIDHGLLHEFRVDLVIEGPPGNQDGAFRDNNDLARILVLSGPLWWVLASRAGALGRRAVAGVGCLATVAGIVFTFSRGGFLALVAAVVVVSLSYRPWWRAVAIPPLFLAGVLAVAPRLYLERVATISQPAQEGSVQGRLEIWKGALEVARKYPLLGQGPGTLRVGVDRRPSHDIFIEVLAETGAVGLVAYLCVLLTTVLTLHRLRRPPAGGVVGQWLHKTSFGLEAALIAYVTAGLALSSPFQSPLFTLIGLTTALQRLAETSEPA